MQSIIQTSILPKWIARLRHNPCLINTNKKPCKPYTLLRRTSETEPFLDIEPFIHLDLENEKNRPLLDLLGVQSTPKNPDIIIEQLP